MTTQYQTESIQVVDISPPFDYFKFIEDQFGVHRPLERIFSIAASFPEADVETLLIEELTPNTEIERENEELQSLNGDYYSDQLQRLSFWLVQFSDKQQLEAEGADNLLGYAILKHDCVPGELDRSHIYEAVFKKYPHEHNYVPRLTKHEIHIDDNQFQIEGELYCQQNTLNKSCAHVAMRTLLNKNSEGRSPTYNQMNEIVRQDWPDFTPSEGLNPNQMKSILDELGFNHFDIDYDQNPSLREKIPYDRLLYSGVESGFGALLGFNLDRGDGEDQVKHIIPVFGHTFNKDTFVPNAELAYFKVGPDTRYQPSENWMSSFIGHDDNFGPDFCIPRNYLPKENVDYVLTLLPDDVSENALVAEAYGLDVYYNLLKYISSSTTESPDGWINRILRLYRDQDFVLRTINIDLVEYIEHLQTIKDLEGNTEDPDVIELIEEMQTVCDRGWLVEVSIPNLFSAHKQKVGEIIVNAESPLDSNGINSKFDPFLVARLLENYYFNESDRDDTRFLVEQGDFTSPTPLFDL